MLLLHSIVNCCVIVAGGFIYISNDYGHTWAVSGPQNNWISICSSSDGATLAAGSYDKGSLGAGYQAGSTSILVEVVRSLSDLGWYVII